MRELEGRCKNTAALFMSDIKGRLIGNIFIRKTIYICLAF